MEPIEGEKVSLSGATMADVLGARPVGGRIAENMEGVACANAANLPNAFDLQEKTIAPAIDYMGPDGLSREEPSPGMKILMELRAKRQAEQGGRQEGYANLSPGQKILFELRAQGK